VNFICDFTTSDLNASSLTVPYEFMLWLHHVKAHGKRESALFVFIFTLVVLFTLKCNLTTGEIFIQFLSEICRAATHFIPILDAISTIHLRADFSAGGKPRHQL
jgi:hypothetical protein